jgi:hypothetical protein
MQKVEGRGHESCYKRPEADVRRLHLTKSWTRTAVLAEWCISLDPIHALQSLGLQTTSRNLTWTTRNVHFFKIRSNITSSFLRNARNKHGEFSYFKSFCLNWMTKHVVLRSSCFRLPAKSKEHIEEMSSPFLKPTR